jgi:23S rRNA (uridine2552-2'-O)-methyltransferase
LAKEHGYRSRASFKLFQVVRAYHLITRGDRVLDLGAAPGGWLQAARKVVGENGYVIGVDKEPIKPLDYENVAVITADLTQDGFLKQIQDRGKFDVVISDLAPNVSGVWSLDHTRQIELARCALRIARQVLKPSGNLMVKVFQGSDLKEFQFEVKSSFKVFRIVKPPASRPESAELYLLGLGFLGE